MHITWHYIPFNAAMIENFLVTKVGFNKNVDVF